MTSRLDAVCCHLFPCSVNITNVGTLLFCPPIFGRPISMINCLISILSEKEQRDIHGKVNDLWTFFQFIFCEDMDQMTSGMTSEMVMSGNTDESCAK